MHRRSMRSMTGALLAWSLAGIAPAVLAQSTPATGTSSSQSSYTYSTDTPVLPNTDRILALQTILDLKLNQTDIAKVLPLLRDLRDRETGFYAGGSGIMADMMITPEGQTPKVSAQDRLQAAVRDFEDSKSKAWDRIQTEIGADKANGLRRLVEPPMSTAQDPFMVEHTARMQRINDLVADLDRAEARRLAATAGGQNGTQNTATTDATNQNAASTPDTVRNVDTQNNQGSVSQITTPPTQTAPVTALNVYGTVYTGYPHVSLSDLVDLLERRMIALDPTNASLEVVRPGGSEPIDYWYIRNKQMGILD